MLSQLTGEGGREALRGKGPGSRGWCRAEPGRQPRRPSDPRSALSHLPSAALRADPVLRAPFRSSRGIRERGMNSKPEEGGCKSECPGGLQEGGAC